MASTNKTTNLELSQFLGTDKPSWLGDYNTDMSKIDTAVHSASATATGADGKADANATAIGTLASLSTDVKTDVVSAINEVDAHADSATTTATSATATANSALTASTTNATAIQGIKDYLNLSVNNTYNGSQFNVTSGSGTIDSTTNLYVARNADGSLAKIYGTIGVSGSTSATRTTIKLNSDTGLHPSSKLTIVNTGIVNGINSYGIANLNLTINTDGTIELEGYHDATTFAYRAFACLIFVKDFGDQPQA